jgi:DNA invertase Pin-like site-specific DNA recombinase
MVANPWSAFPRIDRFVAENGIGFVYSSVDIAIYARISTDKQDTQNQLEQLRAFAKTQGWNVKREYVDVATGKNGDREQFKAMFAAASRHEFSLVLFWVLDRFSRAGVFETLTYLQTLTSYGVGYRSFTEQFLDSCGMFRDAVISILAVVAKQERVRLSERTIAGLARARTQGRIGGRPRVRCDRSELIRLHRAAKSLAQIAMRLKIGKSTVHRLLHEATAAKSQTT